MAPAFFRKDKLLTTIDGEVLEFDPEKIEAARQEVVNRVGFFERHCQPLGADCCVSCQMAGCPIADQG